MREALDPSRRTRNARDKIEGRRAVIVFLAPVIFFILLYFSIRNIVYQGPYSGADELHMLESPSFSRNLHKSNDMIAKDCKNAQEAHRLATEITALYGWTDEEANQFQYTASLLDICNDISIYPWFLHGTYRKLVSSSPVVADHFVKDNLPRAFKSFLTSYNSKHGTALTLDPGR